MKKILPLILSIYFVSCQQSSATGVFIGVDSLAINTRHELIDTSSSSNLEKGDKKSQQKANYGVNAGLRLDLLSLLASAEVFYDNLKTSSKDFNSSAAPTTNNGKVELKDRYGAKLNFGFAILPRITPFLTYGFSHINYYSQTSATNSNSLNKSKLSPLYGAGLIIDLPFGISAKASYDYQSFTMQYAEQGSKVRTMLGVAKLGLVYNF